MPEVLRLYLDQMLRLEVAETLRHEGYDVVRTSEVGQSRADDWQILQKAIAENRILINNPACDLSTYTNVYLIKLI